MNMACLLTYLSLLHFSVPWLIKLCIQIHTRFVIYFKLFLKCIIMGVISKKLFYTLPLYSDNLLNSLTKSNSVYLDALFEHDYGTQE